ncbi:hypothetical protein ACEQPO_15685 [Bacillus sp. SL00103]
MDQPTLEVVEDFAKIGLPTDVQAVLLIEQDGNPEAVPVICKTSQGLSATHCKK